MTSRVVGLVLATFLVCAAGGWTVVQHHCKDEGLREAMDFVCRDCGGVGQYIVNASEHPCCSDGCSVKYLMEHCKEPHTCWEKLQS